MKKKKHEEMERLEELEKAVKFCTQFMSLRGRVITNLTLEKDILYRKLKLLSSK